MRLDKLLLAVVLALWAVCLGVMLSSQGDTGGVDHPEVPHMRHGGMTEHLGTPLGWGWAFGVLTISSFVTLIAFGARKDERLRGGLGWWLLAGLLAYVAAWTWVVMAYESYVEDPSPTLYLFLPAPSAIMLYVLFPVSVLFNLFFVIFFRRSFYSAEDEATYERLVAERRARREPDHRRQPFEPPGTKS